MSILIKTVVSAMLFVAILSGCRDGERQPGAGGGPGLSDTAGEKARAAGKAPEANVVPRDRSIDATNSYSDLFLDSADMESFITRQKLNDTLASSFRNFYDARNFQFAWFASDGLTEQALAFSSLYQYSKDSSTHRKWLDDKMDSLQSEDSLQLTGSEPGLRHTELLMTWRLINYLGNRYPDEKERMAALLRLVPARKRDPFEMADAILSGKAGRDKTINPWYEALVGQLKKYVDLARSGDGEKLKPGHRKYKKGDRAVFITAIKKRLSLIGEMEKATDTSDVFDAALEKAIRSFQTANSLEPDGTIGPLLIRELNIPPSKRVRQILINLERMVWMPPDPTGRLILVNIPEFRLHVLEDGKKVFIMNIVVGKEGHSTVLFSGNLDRIIFNPYWNIPPTIVKKEILPEMEKDKQYLAAHEMEITGQEGGLPVIRQKPGPLNELGKMKFLFPNSFNIYLHDTPHKELFRKAQRAFSHGCIRLADARKLADYLLEGMPEWDAGKMDSVLAAGKERMVKLKEPVPVLIYYLTAGSDEGNSVEFRKDIYGHDARVEEKLFIK